MSGIGPQGLTPAIAAEVATKPPRVILSTTMLCFEQASKNLAYCRNRCNDLKWPYGCRRLGTPSGRRQFSAGNRRLCRRVGFAGAGVLSLRLSRIQSSRRLERETQRNIEPMWLTCRLMPDFKRIVDFRRDSGPAIRAACAQFIVLHPLVEIIFTDIAASL
jgi:hypothetical protein